MAVAKGTLDPYQTRSEQPVVTWGLNKLFQSLDPSLNFLFEMIRDFERSGYISCAPSIPE